MKDFYRNEVDFRIGQKVVNMGSSLLPRGRECKIVDICSNTLKIEKIGWMNPEYFVISSNNDLDKDLKEAEEELLKLKKDYFNTNLEYEAQKKITSELFSKHTALSHQIEKTENKMYKILKEMKEIENEKLV